MEASDELNLYDIPLMALKPSTRLIIVNELNKQKVLASDEGLPRDWRGLVHLTGLPVPGGDSPASQLLTAWEREPSASLGLLEQYLGQMDRWDIIEDIYLMIRDDAKGFTTRMLTVSSGNTEADSNIDNQVLTFDDRIRLEHGQRLQIYDALLLYADEDQHFARQMVDKLENDYSFKVCLKEDLVAGLSTQYDGIMRIISERCHRVILIVSRNFIDSPVNRFFLTFAHAFAVEQQRRIIIPCMYERDYINLPLEINYLHKLDYNRIGLRHYDFWEMLRVAVASPQQLPAFQPPSAVTIREITDSRAERLHTAEACVKPAMPMLKASSDTCRSVSDLASLTGDLSCSSQSNKSSQRMLSGSTLTLPGSKHKSKSPTQFFRKLFQLNPKKKTKATNKIAVRL